VAATFLLVGGASPATHCTSADFDGKPKLLQASDLEISVESTALQRQYTALLGMSLQGVEYSALGPVESVVGDTGINLPADVPFRPEGAPASDLLPLFKDILLATGTENLGVRENSVWYGQGGELVLSQSIRGIPVANGLISLTYSGRTRRITSITAHFVPDLDLPHEPKLSLRQAEDALRKAGIANVRKGTHLTYLAEFSDPSPPRLVWALEVGSARGGLGYFVDAITGSIGSCRPLAPHASCPQPALPKASVHRQSSTEKCRT
jgi:hypothetical protein